MTSSNEIGRSRSSGITTRRLSGSSMTCPIKLQLLQLLDWFSQQDLSGARLSIIQLGAHPEVPNFHGLGELSAAQLSNLLPTRSPITPNQLEIGRNAWSAFRSTDPRRLLELSKQTNEEMPFLADALRRMLEEYPLE